VTTARQIMTARPVFVRDQDSVTEAARRMAVLGVGCVPVLTEDDRLSGMVTDRDIAVKVIAYGHDPGATSCGDLARREVVAIGPDEPVEDVPTVMLSHRVGRVPVVEGERLIGIVGTADLARALPDLPVARMLDLAPAGQLDALPVG
jgi:CBS domain-containing protein